MVLVEDVEASKAPLSLKLHCWVYGGEPSGRQALRRWGAGGGGLGRVQAEAVG